MRSSWAKRRSATKAVRAGVIRTATNSRDSTTISGVTAKITIKGANTALRLPAPTLCSQSQMELMTEDASKVTRTQSSAPSQKKYPSPSARTTINTSGKKDRAMTRVCRQYASARQKESSSSLMKRA